MPIRQWPSSLTSGIQVIRPPFSQTSTYLDEIWQRSLVAFNTVTVIDSVWPGSVHGELQTKRKWLRFFCNTFFSTHNNSSCIKRIPCLTRGLCCRENSGSFLTWARVKNGGFPVFCTINGSDGKRSFRKWAFWGLNPPDIQNPKRETPDPWTILVSRNLFHPSYPT